MAMTGWAEPDAGDSPGMPTAGLLLSARAERGPADPLERARLARDKPDGDPFDADERAANLVARGYAPGHVSQLAQRLDETVAELETERELIAATARRQARIAREHAAGRITALDIAGMRDGDEGDVHRAEQLERRADRLRRELAQVQETMIATPGDADDDPFAAASRRAHDAFAEATRAKFAAAQAGRTEPRPFGAVSRGAAPAECPGPDCQVCADGRRRDAARAAAAQYAPGEVITTEYAAVTR